MLYEVMHSEGDFADNFGESVAVFGDLILVGAYNALVTRGAAFIYVKPYNEAG